MEHFLRIKIPFDVSLEKIKEKASAKASKKSSEKSRKNFLRIILKNPAIPTDEVAQQLKLTPRAIEKQIRQLKKENKIKRVGGRKGGHWEIL